MKTLKIQLLSLLLLTFMGKITFADEARLIFEKSLATEPGKELITSLVAGSIEITSGSSNEVNVKVYGNDEAEEKIIFTAEQTSTGVKVEGKQKEDKKMKNLTIRVEITVPKEYAIKLYSAGGSLSVKDINGKIETNTSGGKINIDNTTGDIEAYTSGGSISINSSKGNIKASTAGGKIEVKGFEGSADVSTAGGNIELNGGNGKIDASTAGGSITMDYSGKNMGIELSTLGGSITAVLPGDFDADADIGTMAGMIKCDFAKAEKENFVSSFIRAKFNNGGETFKCTTSAGNITVTKK